jgi:hypothetical protein
VEVQEEVAVQVEVEALAAAEADRRTTRAMERMVFETAGDTIMITMPRLGAGMVLVLEIPV